MNAVDLIDDVDGSEGPVEPAPPLRYQFEHACMGSGYMLHRVSKSCLVTLRR